jgi:uncharacterized membrane protein YeaQ/YmgE (transglycosylase-associated protein family)
MTNVGLVSTDGGNKRSNLERIELFDEYRDHLHRDPGWRRDRRPRPPDHSGRQAIGWILTFALGLVGAVLGGFLAEGMDIDIWWRVMIVQVIVAAILVALVSFLIRSSVTKRRSHT